MHPCQPVTRPAPSPAAPSLPHTQHAQQSADQPNTCHPTAHSPPPCPAQQHPRPATPGHAQPFLPPAHRSPCAATLTHHSSAQHTPHQCHNHSRPATSCHLPTAYTLPCTNPANQHLPTSPLTTAHGSRAAEEGVGEGGGAALAAGRSTGVGVFRHRVDEIVSRVDELEQRVNEVAQFYSTRKQPNNGSGTKGCVGGASSVAKEKEKPVVAQKKPADVPRKEFVCTKRMQELMRQFGTILRQISQHKWAWPFMQPVDVEGLGLHDYYEVIKKPMDFDTIRTRMEVKDGTGYKNVREIYADVRLVFTNAMTYNDERNDIHQMAKTLLDKFEEKWLQLLPKVIEEETRQKEEEAKVQVEMQMAQEAAVTKMARDTDTELNELSFHLEELREMVLQRCRKMSTEEKRKLGAGLSRLSPEDLTRALEIIAQNNPSFQATAEEVDLDMDALSESTLWRLKFFVKEALEVQAKGCATKSQENTKRKREICDALVKTAKKRGRKVS